MTALLGVTLLGATMKMAKDANRGAAPAEAAPAFPAGIAAEGRVVTYPDGTVTVGTELDGRLVALAVVEGERVKKGAILARMDRVLYEASLREAKARRDEAEAEVRLAEVNLTRVEDLRARDVVSAQELDRSRRDLDASRARAAQAAAEIQRIGALIDKCTILSPIDGTVVSRHTDSGEILEAGDPVVTIADLDRVRIEAEADEADAGRVKVGDPVRITADGYPGTEWSGTVEEAPGWVIPRKLKPQDPARLSDTRVLSVKVAFAEPTPLKLGTTVQVRIEPESGF